jgi:hypothetical protein
MFIKIKEYKREVKFVTFLHKEDITTRRCKKKIRYSPNPSVAAVEYEDTLKL